MSRSLGVVAYRALARRTNDKRYVSSASRPSGQLVWIHAPETGNFAAIEDLAARLSGLRHDLSILVTVPDRRAFDAAGRSFGAQEQVFVEYAPSDHPDAVAAFWRHWTPDLGLWTWGKLMPNLIMQAHSAQCPMVLIDADASGFDGRRDRWLPDLSRQLLEPFAGVLARSSETLIRLEALGLPTAEIDVTTPLEAGGRALPCDDSDLDDLSEQLKGRPVWFASHIQKEEFAIILKAHRKALRLSHRLLLVLHPVSEDLCELIENDATAEGFRFANWTNGDECDDAIQVLLATEHADIGLFYRASPVSFMGSSLMSGSNGQNPFEAAALGSAVLYGPNVRGYLPFYTRLAKAGAARIVHDAETLGNAVTHLISPDKAAAMAHAGWDVTSRGASLTDRVIDLVQRGLDDELEAKHARA